MTLMSNRCPSARGEAEDLFGHREPAFGVHVPQYFYVHQRNPRPIAPLKAWRGYKGNVYFEPLTIHKVSTPAHLLTTTSLSHHQVDDLNPRLPQTRIVSAAAPATTPSSPRRPTTRATTAGAASSVSTRSYRLIPSSPQTFIMDKQAIMTSFNTALQDDLRCIEGMESTGSLAVRPVSGPPNYKTSTKSTDRYSKRRILPKRDRICRGSNFHFPGGKLGGSQNLHNSSADSNKPKNGRTSTCSGRSVIPPSRQNSFVSGHFPGRQLNTMSAGKAPRSRMERNQDLVISGDKFCPPTVMSPILRSTTQFALNPQNSAANTPDILSVYESGLPPLVHVDLGQTGHEVDTDQAISRPSSYYDELNHHLKQQASVGY